MLTRNAQPPNANKAWERCNRSGDSIFDFTKHQPVVDFINRSLPKDACVLILGGNNGYIGCLVGGKNRTFLNLDLQPGPSPFVQTVKADMEAPFSHLRQEGSIPWACVAAFSMEYARPRIVSQRLLEFLRPGETFVWLAHSSDSPLVDRFKTTLELFDLVNSLPITLKDLPDSGWWDFGMQFKKDLSRVFPKLRNSSPFSGSRNRWFWTMYYADEPLTTACGILAKLANVAFGIRDKTDVIQEISDLVDHLSGVVVVRNLIASKLKSPSDLGAAIGPRFVRVGDFRYSSYNPFNPFSPLEEKLRVVGGSFVVRPEATVVS